jgi:hypothetical protein
VGFGGVGSALGVARHGRDGGGEGKGESRVKGEGRKRVCARAWVMKRRWRRW